MAEHYEPMAPLLLMRGREWKALRTETASDAAKHLSLLSLQGGPEAGQPDC